MVKQSRPDDNELISRMEDQGAVSQQGRGGGNVARKVGTRAELNRTQGDLTGDEVERATGSDNPAEDAKKGDKTLAKIQSDRQRS
jgi:hypothetical protein